jgi:hypothetical protein
MAANIVNSPRTVAMGVYVIRAFIKMREDLAANAAGLKRLAEIDKTLLIHDAALREIFENLCLLLAPPTSAAQARNRLLRQRRPRPLPHRQPTKGLNTGGALDFGPWTSDFELFFALPGPSPTASQPLSATDDPAGLPAAPSEHHRGYRQAASVSRAIPS